MHCIVYQLYARVMMAPNSTVPRSTPNSENWLSNLTSLKRSSMLYAIWHVFEVLDITWNRQLALYGFLLLVLYTLRKWSAGSVPPIPLEQTRDLKGKVVFVTNAFTSPALPLLPLLLSHGARVILLTPPEEAKSERALQLLAVLQLSENDDAAKPEIYIEPVDLKSPESIKSFVAQWEKASVRRGALNEEIGRVPIAGIIFFPPVSSTPDLNLLLIKTILPNLQTTVTSLPPDPMLQATAPAQQIRIIQVVDSPFYAAAAKFPPSTSSSAIWRRKAASTLDNVILFKEAHHRLVKPDDKILFLSVSPGLTRSSLFEFLRADTQDPIFGRSSAWLFKQLFMLLNLLWIIALSPLVWLLGKSHLEGAKGIEWLMVAPMKGVRDGQAVKGVQGGSLFRDGNDAGIYLYGMQDSATGEALWRLHEERTGTM